MKKFDILAALVLVAVVMTVSGCLDPKRAFVFNQSGGDISEVDLTTGAVTDNAGGLELGPTTSRAVVSGDVAYVVNSGEFPAATEASVQAINLRTKTLLKTTDLPDGENPWAIAVLNATKAYVTSWIGDQVFVVNPTAGTITDQIALPEKAGAEGVILLDGLVYVANSGYDAATYSYNPGTISVIDTTTDTIVNTINTSEVNPQDLAVDSNGMINVVCTGDYWSAFGVVDVIDPATQTVVDSISVGGSPSTITAAGNFLLMGDGDFDSCNIRVVNADTGAVVHGGDTPWELGATSDWCTVGKIGEASGLSGIKAYVPAGVYGAEALLFEIGVSGAAPVLVNTHDLAPAANLPAAVAITNY